MKYKKVRLKVYPAFDLSMTACKEFEFDSMEELIAAKNSIASMLLYLQDELAVMNDYSNVFIVEILPMAENSVWEEIEGV